MLGKKSTIPHSPFRIPLSRSALTLAEVLIAMGLLTIGLLGVAAVFPVGGYYMQSGDVTDRAGAIAEAALEDAIIKGYLDPERWVVHDVNANGASSGLFIWMLDGLRDNNGQLLRDGLRPAIPKRDSFNAADRAVLGTPQLPGNYTSKLMGGVVVLDPIGLAGALTEPTNALVRNKVLSTAVQRFPASILDGSDATWQDWTVATPPFLWPVRRATPIHSAALLNSPATFNRQLSGALKAFSAADDLALSLPDSGDEPAQGLWEVASNAPAARQSAGAYSWILSVSPGSSVERDAIATQADAYPVEVSAVVFHKRVVPRGVQGTLEAERLVNARVVSVGPGGGEMLLEKRAGENAAPAPFDALQSLSPFENLRVGEYVMVVGPHPLSNSLRPMLALRWCRVLGIESEGTTNVGTGTVTLDRDQRVLVSLRGPDWPWTDLTNPLSSNLRVGILPGAVAVHTKTMRLEEGSEWSVR